MLITVENHRHAGYVVARRSPGEPVLVEPGLYWEKEEAIRALWSTFRTAFEDYHADDNSEDLSVGVNPFLCAFCVLMCHPPNARILAGRG